MDLGIERHAGPDGTARLVLRGELDIGSRDLLREALLAEDHAGTEVLVVLDQLDYLDSAGIAELLDGAARARTAGRRFAVTPGAGHVRHVLWISGVLPALCDAGARAAEPARPLSRPPARATPHPAGAA